MQDFFIQQTIFICTTMAIFYVPGWSFLRAVFAKNFFTPLETHILSVPISFMIITLSTVIAHYFGMPIDAYHILILFFMITGSLCVIAILRKHKDTPLPHSNLFTFSRRYMAAFVMICMFMIIIKTIYLINTVFPTTTDLGHHLYWVEKIIQNHTLPTYTNLEITSHANGYAFSEPISMPDFIIGEHIFIAIIALLTKLPLISSFPSILLHVLNIYTTLLIFIFTRRLFATHAHGNMIALLAFLMIGPLWAISGAQSKFVSGGVIGNILGNLLIPTIFYFLFHALTKKNVAALCTTILLSLTIAYTHHLSAFIFGYSAIFGIMFFIILQRDGLRGYRSILSPFHHPLTLILIITTILWLFVIDPPSYLAKEAITSSVGTPEKSTRIGIPFNQLMIMIGDARFVLGVIGTMILGMTTFFYRFRDRKKKLTPSTLYSTIIILGWSIATLSMTLIPHVLHVNIISSRIATYTAFPLAILAAFALMWTYNATIHHKDHTFYIPQNASFFFFFLCFTFIFASGMKDNATSLNAAPQTNDALQTFHVGNYARNALKKSIMTDNIWMIKDHNYITADTWLKIFFTYDYSYPLSRAYFARYESNPDRETCTRDMISTPHTEKSQQCYNDLNVKLVLVSTEQDGSQFTSSSDFYRIYQNNSLSLFVKK